MPRGLGRCLGGGHFFLGEVGLDRVVLMVGINDLSQIRLLFGACQLGLTLLLRSYPYKIFTQGNITRPSRKGIIGRYGFSLQGCLADDKTPMPLGSPQDPRHRHTVGF